MLFHALQIPLFEVCLRLFRTAMASCASRVLFHGLPLIRERLLRLGACSRLPDAFTTDMVRPGFDPRHVLVAQIALSVSKLQKNSSFETEGDRMMSWVNRTA